MKDYNGFSSSARARAQRWLNEQISLRLITPPTTCDLCGQTHGIIDMHAEDYSEPFGPQTHEFGLCYLCHMMLHCRHGSPEAWAKYLTHIQRGTFAASVSRDWGRVKGILMGKIPAIETRSPAGRYDRAGLIPILRDPIQEKRMQRDFYSR